MNEIAAATNSSQNTNLPINQNINLTERQLDQLQAAVALILSAPLNVVTPSDEHIVAMRFEQVLSSSEDTRLPEKAFSREPLVTSFSIAKLDKEGWVLHGTFEPHFFLLTKEDSKMQFQDGGHEIASRVGVYFDRAYDNYALNTWQTTFACVETEYDKGLVILRAVINDLAPSLAAHLTGNDWGDVTADTIREFCQKHSRAALALTQRFSSNFANDLIIT